MTSVRYCPHQPNCEIKEIQVKEGKEMDLAKPLTYGHYAKPNKRWSCVYDTVGNCSYVTELNNIEHILHLLQERK